MGYPPFALSSINVFSF